MGPCQTKNSSLVLSAGEDARLTCGTGVLARQIVEYGLEIGQTLRKSGSVPSQLSSLIRLRGPALRAGRWSLDIFAAEPMSSQGLTRGSPRSG
jgi:hypothetical protein